MKFEYQDKIDKYVRGEMSSEERKEFEQELQENQELCDQTSYTKKVKNLVSSREQKMALLRDWEEEDEREKQKVAVASYRPTGTECYAPNETASSPAYSQKTKKRLWYWISGIAAILIVGFFVVSPMFNDEGTLRGPNDGDVRGGDAVFESMPASANDTTSVDSVESSKIDNE